MKKSNSLKVILFVCGWVLLFSFFASLNDTANACDKKYIAEMGCIVVDAKKENDGVSSIIPNSVIIGQAVLETGNGKSKAAKRKNNHFGLISPKTKKTMSFNSTEDSVEKYLSSIDKNKAYRSLREKLKQKNTKDYKTLVFMLSDAYAEDNRYTQKLLGVIDRCELRRFDSFY